MGALEKALIAVSSGPGETNTSQPHHLKKPVNVFLWRFWLWQVKVMAVELAWTIISCGELTDGLSDPLTTVLYSGSEIALQQTVCLLKTF